MASGYKSGRYWRRRQNMRYYQAFRAVIGIVGRDAKSMLDVGSGNAPYLDWFEHIPQRVSVDREPPYSSAQVKGIQADFLTYDFGQRFDIVTCLQVLEHVRDAAPFAQRLLALGDVVVASVPYKWRAGGSRHHVNDPVDLRKLNAWFGRKADWSRVVAEPDSTRARLIAIYDTTGQRGNFREVDEAVGQTRPPFAVRIWQLLKRLV